MAKVKAISNFDHNGWHEQGEVFEVDDNDVELLVRVEAVVVHEEGEDDGRLEDAPETPPVDETPEEPQAPETPDGGSEEQAPLVPTETPETPVEEPVTPTSETPSQEPSQEGETALPETPQQETPVQPTQEQIDQDLAASESSSEQPGTPSEEVHIG